MIAMSISIVLHSQTLKGVYTYRLKKIAHWQKTKWLLELGFDAGNYREMKQLQLICSRLYWKRCIPGHMGNFSREMKTIRKNKMDVILKNILTYMSFITLR